MASDHRRERGLNRGERDDSSGNLNRGERKNWGGLGGDEGCAGRGVGDGESGKMILIHLTVNGETYFAECKTRKEADAKVKEWLEEKQKHYPHKTFTPTYYTGKKLK